MQKMTRHSLFHRMLKVTLGDALTRMRCNGQSVTEKINGEHQWKARSLVTFGIVAVFLSGCSRGVENDLADYQQRLSRLLDEPKIAVELPSNPRMPRTQEVQTPIPEISISLLDSMRLDRCRVGQLVAERNSSLGRVQSTQSRVHYEIQMIAALQECLASPAADEERIAELLTSALAHKVDTLPLWFDRFLTSESVIRERMRVSRSTLNLENTQQGSASVAALTYFADVFTGLSTDPLGYQVDPEHWNEHMRHLGQNNFLSDFWRTQQVVHGYLIELNNMLNDAGDKVGCQGQSVPQQAHYLQNVMHSLWIAELQTKLARLQGYEQQIAAQLRRLQQFVRHEPWQNYIEELIGTESHGEYIREHSREHAQHYQGFLTQCGFDITN